MKSMAEYWSFLNRLRHDLGKRYTVASEHAGDSQHLNIVVRSLRRSELLVVTMETPWLALVTLPEPPGAVRVEYKHLVVLIAQFFDAPDALPAQSFSWPGTSESREELRNALSPRRRLTLR